MTKLVRKGSEDTERVRGREMEVELEQFWSRDTGGSELERWGAWECGIFNVEVPVGHRSWRDRRSRGKDKVSGRRR